MGVDGFRDLPEEGFEELERGHDDIDMQANTAAETTAGGDVGSAVGSTGDAAESAEIEVKVEDKPGNRIPRPKVVPRARLPKIRYYEMSCVQCGYNVASWHEPFESEKFLCRGGQEVAYVGLADIFNRSWKMMSRKKVLHREEA